jgi:uncharacterized damage-inducible protein DinB
VFAEVLRKQYEYTCWATGHVLDTAGALTTEQLLAPDAAGQSSIRDTLVHLMGAHRGWLSWWDGSLSAMEAYNRQMSPADYHDVPALRRAWAEIEQQTLAFVSGLRDEDPGRIYGFDLPNGKRWEMPLWGMMSHIVNHGTQHRSEVAARLTGYGYSPGDLDLLYYLARPADAPETD